MTDYSLFPRYGGGSRWEASDLTNPMKCTKGTYSPTISASGGTPAVGSGFLTGRWTRNGLRIIGGFDLSIVSGTIAGTSWRISLPFNADLTAQTVGVLGAASDCIGFAQTSSSTSAQALVCSILISAVKEMIFYAAGSTASRGSADFTTTARIKGSFEYMADPAEFP